ncbi:hypothetical protein CANCADRAFT_44784 [Tortispora caseinolytica NRRL Y-17796]|uniref:Uncharacterized protein n=1 Tax=Tortispora caseinolytica NRRL Y-17796 TaxID=767744 RepID=A0A1E4THG1_9ASCO|nr:hypothetical protein CANCADRAFT_44784 [Tortispora caseinolytica NRRL Y-17796]
MSQMGALANDTQYRDFALKRVSQAFKRNELDIATTFGFPKSSVGLTISDLESISQEYRSHDSNGALTVLNYTLSRHHKPIAQLQLTILNDQGYNDSLRARIDLLMLYPSPVSHSLEKFSFDYSNPSSSDRSDPDHPDYIDVTAHRVR